MSNPQYSAVRAPGREHIPIYPKGFIGLRIAQLVLTVIILGLAAYGLAMFPTSGDVYITVVCIFTLITSIYHLVCHYNQPKGYNYWAVLALDIFLVVMWLASFALLASEVSILFLYFGYSYGYYSYYDDTAASVPACLAAAAGLGGVQFVLHIVSLAIHGVRLHRHRAVGLHCTPGAPQTLPTTNVTAVPNGAEKFQAAYPQQQQPYMPQQQQPMPMYQQQQPIPQQGYPQPQQQMPQQYYAPQQGQVPSQPTGGSWPSQPSQPQQQQYYQQGPPVPLFAQTTGGSTIQSPQQQQQQQPVGQELPNNQVGQQQQQ
jgi:hypothetical protein